MPTIKDILVPDIGGATDVEVIEVVVKPGDQVQAEDTLITLESDKASMDIPSPFSGVVKDLKVKLGDKVSEGSLMLTLESDEAEDENTSGQVGAEKQPEKAVRRAPQQAPKVSSGVVTPIANNANAYAGPAVRRLANQLGVDLSRVTGTGRKYRIVIEDVHGFVKGILQGGGAPGLSVAKAPDVDFSRFGEIETTPLSRIKKLSGANLHRNWVTVPHITQFDEADITDMEAFRQENKTDVAKRGAKLTPLVFIMKAVVETLKEFPQFNSSLDNSGENLVMKKYFHIGVAVDTPNGLVVPVIRDVNCKDMIELAIELGELSQRAREGKLKSKEMQGGCFSISSLGGIGGTAFTPIVNSPEVAILGVSRSAMKPKFIDGQFEPRLMLPLCLSYDHRVIDGADGARFVTHLSACLTDIRKILL